jgi:8-oxo-dGTP diphosphatase
MIDVTCAIILKGNKILVTQRSEIMSHPLKWEFPGGKIELNETAEYCLHREIKEELNLKISILKRLEPNLFDYGDFEINLIPFVTKYISGNISLAEHKNFKWLTQERLKTLDWTLADIAVLNEFLEFHYDTTRTL